MFFATWVYPLKFRIFQSGLQMSHTILIQIFSFIGEHNIYTCGSDFPTALTYMYSSPNGRHLGRCTESRAQNVCYCLHLKDVWKCITFCLIRCPKLKNKAISCVFNVNQVQLDKSYFYATGKKNFSILNHVCASKNPISNLVLLNRERHHSLVLRSQWKTGKRNKDCQGFVARETMLDGRNEEETKYIWVF